jgi:uncharacterized protein YcbX
LTCGAWARSPTRAWRRGASAGTRRARAAGEVTGPELLATLSTYRESGEFGVMFGMNLVTVKTGPVRVGDALEIS